MLVPSIILIISFLVVLYITPWMIRFLRKIGLVVKDQNKKDKPLIPVSGGVAVASGVFLSMMVYIFIRTFYFDDSGSLLLIFAGLTSLLIITFVGFIDDLLIRKDKEQSSGLKQWQKPLLTLMAAVPLIVINAGNTTVGLPLFGVVDLGLFYPLVIIPLAVVFSANMVNLLGGFNGLEAGMGIVYTGMLAAFAYVHNEYIAALIAAVTFSALLAFIIFNWTPAKIFPGDSLTYMLGGVIAVVGIIGNIEKAALIVSIPFIIEFFLKLRSKFKAQTYGEEVNGKIKSFYDKVYSIPHIFTITGRFTEKQIVAYMILLELVVSSLIWII